MSGFRMVLLCLLIFAACAPVAAQGSIELAVIEGVIVPPGADRGGNRRVSTAETQSGIITRTSDILVRPVYTVNTRLAFVREHGEFGGLLTEPGQRVSEGDLLSEQIWNNRGWREYLIPDLEIQQQRAEFNLEQHHRRFREENNDWLIELGEARLLAELRDDPLYILRLSRMELAYQQFLSEAEIARLAYEQSIHDTLNNPTLREGLYAPFDGIITSVSRRAALIQFVTWAEMPYVVRLADENSAAFMMHGYPEEIRHGKKFTVTGEIDGNEISFTARVVSDLIAAGYFPIMQPERARRQFFMAPEDPAALDEALAAIGKTFFDLVYEDAYFRAVSYEADILGPAGVILPIRTIQQRNITNYVHIFKNERQFVRNITVGAQHGAHHVGYAEILCGLEPGQAVVIP